MRKVPSLLKQTALLIALLIPTAMLAGASLPAAARSHDVELVRFPTNLPPDHPHIRPVTVKAALYLPTGPTPLFSAVIIAPSSGGISRAREIYYARELTRVGIAALVLDSFGSRGLQQSIYDQSVLEEWEVENDAVAGLRWLLADGRFQPGRIAIMGVSKGGTAAMNTALTARRSWMNLTNIRFAAHIAISPDCVWINRSALSTKAPILFLLAELDDQTPPEPCVTQAERMRRAGNPNVRVKVYEGAHHAWEELSRKPLYDPRAENYSRCRVWIQDDGSMRSAETGELVPERNWRRWAKANCMFLGAHCCGGTAQLKQRATQDILTFLKENGF